MGLALTCFACRGTAKAAADDPDTADHDRLARIVASDEALDRALRAADDASRAGDDAKGATLLETDATRAADEAIAEAEREPLQTPWARTRRDALLGVMRERRASIPSYAEAMRGEDLEAKLIVVTLQIDLQKRALDTATAALAPAGESVPRSAPPAARPAGDAG